MAKRLKKGDLVAIIAGKDKGKQGKILEVRVNSGRVLVEGINRVKKHMKPSQTNPQGGIKDMEAPLHVSNVMLVDPKTNKGGRITITRKGDKVIRAFKKTGTELKA
jgi:large subunit ribosomal protein L24